MKYRELLAVIIIIIIIIIIFQLVLSLAQATLV